MTEESANWCRFAQLIINTGAKVLRVFILQEIVADIFRDYSKGWRDIMEQLNCDHVSIFWAEFDAKFQRTVVFRDTTFEKLHDTWKVQIDTQATISQQIDQLKEWKKDIEREQRKYISEDIKVMLNSWLSQIVELIQQLTSRCTFMRKWNDDFLILLYYSENVLYSQAEEADQFQKLCGRELRFITSQSHSTDQQRVQNLKTNLQAWMNNCDKVLRSFKNDCDNLIVSGLEKAQNDTEIVDCLNKLKNLTDKGLTSKIDIFCGTWYSKIQKVFDNCDKGNYTEAISCLETIPSLKDMKIQNFFNEIVTNLRKKKRFKEMVSRLEGISRATELEKLDLSSLVFTLRESKIVKFLQLESDEDLPDWYTSPGIDILRLKVHRNDVVAHIQETKISRGEFEILWRNVQTLLCRIASRCGRKFTSDITREIDQMKTTPLEPHKIRELRIELIMWCKNDVKADISPSLQLMMDSIHTAEETFRQDTASSDIPPVRLVKAAADTVSWLFGGK